MYLIGKRKSSSLALLFVVFVFDGNDDIILEFIFPNNYRNNNSRQGIIIKYSRTYYPGQILKKIFYIYIIYMLQP